MSLLTPHMKSFLLQSSVPCEAVPSTSPMPDAQAAWPKAATATTFHETKSESLIVTQVQVEFNSSCRSLTLPWAWISRPLRT